MPQLLDDDAISHGLQGTQWQRQGDRLVRTADRGDFAGSMRFVNDVARLAEEANHHPDIAISWSKVTLTLSTHTAGGITQADIDLARRIDAEAS